MIVKLKIPLEKWERWTKLTKFRMDHKKARATHDEQPTQLYTERDGEQRLRKDLSRKWCFFWLAVKKVGKQLQFRKKRLNLQRYKTTKKRKQIYSERFKLGDHTKHSLIPVRCRSPSLTHTRIPPHPPLQNTPPACRPFLRLLGCQILSSFLRLLPSTKFLPGY